MNALSAQRRGLARYRIVVDPRAGHDKPYRITDDAWNGAYCAVPDASGHLQVLAFRNAKGAREWLARMGE